MTDKQERCGDKAMDFRLTCDRDKDHVLSADPADWHEAISTTKTSHESEGWTVTATQIETVRWAPQPWHIPRAGTTGKE